MNFAPIVFWGLKLFYRDGIKVKLVNYAADWIYMIC